MKVVWLVPPCDDGFPNIGQYRFYKKMPIRISIIYPYLSASGCTMLKQRGFNVEFVDCPTMNLKYKDMVHTCVDADYVVLEARTPIMSQIWTVCEQIHELRFPDRIKIILYGDHVSYLPYESLPYCDYIVRGGDYDFGVCDLLEIIRSGKAPPRVFDCDLVDNLDYAPLVDRDLVPYQLYYESWRNRKNFLWIMSGRGCFHNCTYCAWVKTLWDRRIRLRSPENVAEEFLMLHEKYGEIEVLDDADLFETKWGTAFSNILLKHGLKEEVLWAFQTHPTMINSLENLRTMRRAGLRTVKLGMESGNQETLDFIRKGLTVEQSEKAVFMLKEADIRVHANLMVGFPNETKDMAYRTIEWVKKLDPNQAQFSLLIPYPNTELYQWAKDNGKLLVPERVWSLFDASTPMLKMEGMSGEEITQLYRDSWSRFYFNPKYIWDHAKKVRHFYGVRQLWNGFRSVKYGHMKAMK